MRGAENLFRHCGSLSLGKNNHSGRLMSPYRKTEPIQHPENELESLRAPSRNVHVVVGKICMMTPANTSNATGKSVPARTATEVDPSGP